MTTQPPVLVVLGQGSLAAARRVQEALPGSLVLGLAGRVCGADQSYDEFGATLRRFYGEDTPIVAFCAAGIVIRALAPLLQDKRAEPPVLALAEDGSAVVPLLGGLRGVNALARQIGAALGTTPAITTTGEVRFAATLESPPEGYVLRDRGASKRFMSDLLAGATVRLEGEAPWLVATRLPFADDGRLAIVVTTREQEAGESELVIHPLSIAVAVTPGPDLPARVRASLAQHGLSRLAVAAVLAAEADAASSEVHAVVADLKRPLRLVAAMGLEQMVAMAVPSPVEGPFINQGIVVAVAGAPLDPATIGRAQGRLAVIGLGPGAEGWKTPDARHELAACTDVVGYETYVAMAGPFRAGQTVHGSDNREELARAHHALELAAEGRHVVVVSSGDPGIFAMAAAVLEALEDESDPARRAVELVIVPGISAAQGAAARAGAPLGHDFCILSLSDNLKPWPVIEQRLDHAAAADLVIALYNPISRARPHQLGRALEILRGHRLPQTPVVLGRDVGRDGETLRVVALGDLVPGDVDMRTVVIVGSSTTRSFARADGSTWTYTPRWYGERPVSGD